MKIVNLIAFLYVSTFTLTACVSSVGPSYSSKSSSARPVSKDVVMTEKWFLTELNNAPYQGPRITLEISTGNRVIGFSGCNRYFSSVDMFSGDRVKFGSVGSTRKLCADHNSNQLEQRYLGALRSVTHYNKSNNRLVLKDDYSSLTFYRKSVR